MPLRLRLAVLFALATAVVIAVGGMAFVLQLRVSVDAALDPGLRARAQAVADEWGSGEGLSGSGVTEPVQLLDLDGRVLDAAAVGTAALLDADQLRQARAGQVSFTAEVDGDRSRVLGTAGAGDRVLVAVATGTDVSDAALERAESALLLGGPPAVLLAGVGAWLLAGAVLRPVERMRRQAAEISDQDLGRRLPVPGTRDEIAALGATMNGLLARLQQVLERERGFVADAGHELRTPLAILRTELELAERPGRSREDLVAAVAAAGQETDRLIRLAEDLLLLARADNHQPFLRPGEVSLLALLDEAARGAQTRAAGRGVRVGVSDHGAGDHPGAERPGREGVTVMADSDRLRQAVDNLLDNALRHAPSDSTIEVMVSRPGDRRVSIEVADRGPGFPPEFLPRAFERFERAESARSRDGGGTGLGLSIVRAIIDAHGGRVVARNRDGGGAAVTIDLPIAPCEGARPGTQGS